VVVLDAGAVDGAEGGGVLRLGGADGGEAALEQVADGAGDALEVVLGDAGGGLGLEVEEPAVEQGPECAGVPLAGLEGLEGAAVDGLEVVERGVCLGDLDEGGGEALLAGTVLEPAGEEGLAGAVITADGLEAGPAGRGRGQLLVDIRGEVFEADREVLRSERVVSTSPVAARTSRSARVSAASPRRRRSS